MYDHVWPGVGTEEKIDGYKQNVTDEEEFRSEKLRQAKGRGE